MRPWLEKKKTKKKKRRYSEEAAPNTMSSDAPDLLDELEEQCGSRPTNPPRQLQLLLQNHKMFTVARKAAEEYLDGLRAAHEADEEHLDGLRAAHEADEEHLDGLHLRSH